MNKTNCFNKLDVEHSQSPASIELELHETSKMSTLNELADVGAEKLKERGLVFGQLKSVADRNRDNNQEQPYITCTTTTASVHVSGKETKQDHMIQQPASSRAATNAVSYAGTIEAGFKTVEDEEDIQSQPAHAVACDGMYRHSYLHKTIIRVLGRYVVLSS